MTHEFPPRDENKESTINWTAVKDRYFTKVEKLIHESNLTNNTQRTNQLEKLKDLISEFMTYLENKKIDSVEKAQSAVRFAQEKTDNDEDKKLYEQIWNLLDARDLNI